MKAWFASNLAEIAAVAGIVALTVEAWRSMAPPSPRPASHVATLAARWYAEEPNYAVRMMNPLGLTLFAIDRSGCVVLGPPMLDGYQGGNGRPLFGAQYAEDQRDHILTWRLGDGPPILATTPSGELLALGPLMLDGCWCPPTPIGQFDVRLTCDVAWP